MMMRTEKLICRHSAHICYLLCGRRDSCCRDVASAWESLRSHLLVDHLQLMLLGMVVVLL